jgi:hypothetical protein
LRGTEQAFAKKSTPSPPRCHQPRADGVAGQGWLEVILAAAKANRFMAGRTARTVPLAFFFNLALIGESFSLAYIKDDMKPLGIKAKVALAPASPRS